MTSEPDTARLNIRDELATLKRERIFEAAADLFYERGYENTTLDAVGQRLGVTKPFIYSHFDTKAELLAEICSRGIASALEAMDGVLALREEPVKSLDLLSHRFVTAVLGSQKHVAIYMREEKNLEPKDAVRIADMRRDFDAKLSRLLEKGVASGDFDIGDARMAALAIGGIVTWAYNWYRPNGRLKLPEIAGHMSSLILAMAGVKKRRRSAPLRPSTTARAAAERQHPSSVQRSGRPTRGGAR
jgi:TetR/AcrR family transcriptional regulator, cholesterol catabolism regulator